MHIRQPEAELSILFVGDKKMQELNAAFRDVNRATDVLSFSQQNSDELRVKSDELRRKKKSSGPFTCHPPLFLGDIVISIPTAVRQAKISGAGLYDEIYRLMVHGILHLLGYDHEKSCCRARSMKKKEREVFNAIKKIF
ncbi:MAG: rRNA maturation RNase YbeY [Nitrospirae bacterium]|nr:rRNA maturation RNase YbeY [Nitrospirota bacterium]